GVGVLERAGYTVELAGLNCCCRPMISKGFLHQARETIHDQLPALLRRVREGIPILGLEPSCLLTLTDEWPELLPGPETRQVADAAHLVEPWLVQQRDTGRCDLKLMPQPGTCVLHGHCHQKALVGTAGTAAALRLVRSLGSTCSIRAAAAWRGRSVSRRSTTI